MKIETKVLWRVLAGLVIAMPLASYAETETTQLDVEMGIAEAITFSCDTTLSFGVTRIPLGGDSAGEITIDPDTGDITSIESADFTLDDQRSQRGVCNLSGSVAADDTEVKITFPGSGANEMSGDTVLNLDAGNLENPEVTLTSSDETTQSGEAKVFIGGTLKLKEGELKKNNYGGYSITVDVKVEI